MLKANVISRERKISLLTQPEGGKENKIFQLARLFLSNSVSRSAKVSPLVYACWRKVDNISNSSPFLADFPGAGG